MGAPRNKRWWRKTEWEGSGEAKNRRGRGRGDRGKQGGGRGAETKGAGRFPPLEKRKRNQGVLGGKQGQVT